MKRFLNTRYSKVPSIYMVTSPLAISAVPFWIIWRAKLDYGIRQMKKSKRNAIGVAVPMRGWNTSGVGYMLESIHIPQTRLKLIEFQIGR